MAWTYEFEAELRWRIKHHYLTVQAPTGKGADSCRGKVAFDHPNEARTAMRHKDISDHRSVYRCRYCQRWHVGTTLSKRNTPKDDRHERSA